MIYFILSFVAVFLAGFMNSSMDKCGSHFYRSIFQKLNPKYWGPDSWRNKYVDGDDKKGRRKWHGIVIPVQLTDWWHLAKALMVLFNAIGLVLACLSNVLVLSSILSIILSLIGYWWLFGVGFTLGWDYLLDKPFWDKVKEKFDNFRSV